MQKRAQGNQPPTTMIFLREALANETISYNKDGDLVKQAHYTRKRGMGEMEQYIVITRQGSAMYFHLVWNQNLNNGEGDWTPINALSCADLEDLYQTANDNVKKILDDTRWKPIV